MNQTKVIAFQIDTGATCNVLPFKEYQHVTGDFRGQNLQTTKNVLVMHNKPRVIPKGSTKVQLDRGGCGYCIQFLVVKNCEIPLFSLETSKQLELVKTIDSKSLLNSQVLSDRRQVNVCMSNDPIGKEQIICKYRDVFDGIGCLPGDYNIKIRAQLKILTERDIG